MFLKPTNNTDHCIVCRCFSSVDQFCDLVRVNLQEIEVVLCQTCALTLIRELIDRYYPVWGQALMNSDAVEAEREACCCDVCPWCKLDIPLYQEDPDGHFGWYHSGDGERFEQCKAAAIRARGGEDEDDPTA